MIIYKRNDILNRFLLLTPKKRNEVLYSAVRIMFTGEEIVKPLKRKGRNNGLTYYKAQNEILLMALMNSLYKKKKPFLCIAIAMGYDYHNENEFIKY